MSEVSVSGGYLHVFNHDGVEVLRALGEALLNDGSVLSTLGPDGGLTWDVDAYDDSTLVRLRFINQNAASIKLEQLRPLVARRGYAALPLKALRILQTGWQSWSRAHPPAPFEANMTSAAPPIRGPDLPYRRADSEVVAWMTILEADDRPSLLLGFTAARHQLGTLEIIRSDGGGHALVAATELDGVEVAAGAQAVSELLLIGVGDSEKLLDLYARATAEQMAARAPREVPTGWCSWYQFYTRVTEADVDRNLRSLVRHRAQLPMHLVQVDDGYQHAVGDWLELNEKFRGGMRALVERIRDNGFTPGVWLAPFIISAHSNVLAAHPDWVVRDEAGQPLNALDNWGSANYAVDTTRPDVLEWLENVIRTVCMDWGFEYLKLDFLYAAAMRGVRHDPHVTAVEAYRRGLQVLRKSAGDRFILGCGAPLLPSVGLVDGMRVGSDVAAYWGTEGNADGPSLRNALRATLARLWLHGHWWTNDPDCAIVRSSESELTPSEVMAWLSVIALSGGMVVVGDDLSRLGHAGLHLLERLLPPSGVAARALGPLVEFLPERVHLRVDRPWGNWDVVATANWSDIPKRARFDPRDFGLTPRPLHVFDLWSAEYLGLHAAAIELGELPVHALRLLAVRPDVGRPQVVGSTGHLLGDATDLADEAWDAHARTLTLLPSRVGPSARRGDFIVYDPDGPLRRVPFAASDPTPTQLVFR
jgi:alpha-galactosidase